MSHIVSIKTKIRDPVALVAACQRLRLEQPVQGTAQVYSTPATGLIVKLPGWLYPVVVDTQCGEIQYDNYGGGWGAQSELDKLLQGYAVEKTRIEARRAGHTITEQHLEDGSIKLRIQVAAGIGGGV